jgi:hypothetical protein
MFACARITFEDGYEEVEGGDQKHPEEQTVEQLDDADREVESQGLTLGEVKCSIDQKDKGQVEEDKYERATHKEPVSHFSTVSDGCRVDSNHIKYSCNI